MGHFWRCGASLAGLGGFSAARVEEVAKISKLRSQKRESSGSLVAALGASWCPFAPPGWKKRGQWRPKWHRGGFVKIGVFLCVFDDFGGLGAQWELQMTIWRHAWTDLLTKRRIFETLGRHCCFKSALGVPKVVPVLRWRAVNVGRCQ